MVNPSPTPARIRPAAMPSAPPAAPGAEPPVKSATACAAISGRQKVINPKPATAINIPIVPVMR
jgi:hypothetical protein